MSITDRIEADAARWLLRREEPNWSDSDQEALEAWLAAAVAHRVAYYRLEYGWRKTDRLVALRHPPPRETRPTLRYWRPWTVAASIALVLAGLGLALVINYSGGTRYVTNVGDHQNVTLADSSRVQMNTATRLRASVTDTAHSVWLDTGEAYFEVTHLAGRPFVVYAGDRRVTVLGTKFSVRKLGSDVKVSVLEGKVRVDGPAAAANPKLAIVDPGEELFARGDSTVVVPATLDKVNAELTWRSGQLTFDGTSLGDVVSEFNRYNRQQLVVAPDAASIRVGGMFEAANVDGFLRLLHDAYGLRVERAGDEIKISQ